MTNITATDTPKPIKRAKTVRVVESNGSISNCKGKSNDQFKNSNKQKLTWLIGHIITLSFSILYLTSLSIKFIFQSSESSSSTNIAKSFSFVNLTYRVLFIAVIITYSTSLLQKYKTSRPSLYTLLSTESFQYLGLAIGWLLTDRSVSKMIPYFIYSLLHLSKSFSEYYNHIDINIKQNDKFKSIIISNLNKLTNIINSSNYKNFLLLSISYSELWICFKLFGNMLLLRGTSGYLLIIYFGFYRLRIKTCQFTRESLELIIKKIDLIFQNPNIPESYKKHYQILKNWKGWSNNSTTNSNSNLKKKDTKLQTNVKN